MKKIIFIALILVFLFGCTEQNQQAQNKTGDENTMTNDLQNTVENGDLIKAHYTGTLDDGTQFDSSVGGNPLEFIVGAGNMIAGFDKGVVGMKLNEEKNIHIPASEAYGEENPAAIVDFNKQEFIDNGMEPIIGGQVRAGNGAAGTITAIDGNKVTVNFNHALAGKALNFKIKIVSIQKK